ncbi:TadE family protein [Raoultella ornithinolytica]|nr:pilus assembly protein [Raoultella ornithinolytica]HDH7815435.1 pilus assembly protein [Raoultella ornithinolytica]
MFKKVKNGLRHYLSAEHGVAAMEFSMVFIPFIISILFIAEMCRVVFISSALDLIIAESGHIAAITRAPENYQQYFNAEINKRMADWPLISREIHVELSVSWCDSISAVINHTCTTMDARNKPLAFYKVTTDYQPLFFFFPSQSVIRELSRRILLVQEFQREAENDE